MTEHSRKATTERPLQRMFLAVPPRYDLVNRVITWGMDARWRHLAARECLVVNPKYILDLGCGTGDLSVNLARLTGKDVALYGVDYSEPMLEIARRKAAKLVPGRKITFLQGDADSLPFPDGSFDCVGISFAFRNLTYKNPVAQRHLVEVLRVLRDGGRYVIVETSQPQLGLVRRLFHLYLRWFAFPLGYLISGNHGAYRYLTESASRFFTAEEVEQMLLQAGFRRVTFRRLFFGVTCLHVAEK